MIGQDNTLDINFKNLNYKTNYKNQIFIKEDILKEFEEYKNEHDLKLKKNNLMAKLKTNSNNQNDKSFHNKSGANGDSKSLDGLSFSLNKNNRNLIYNNNIDNSNKNVLLYELLENLRNKYKNNENVQPNNNAQSENSKDLSINKLKRQYSRRKDNSINRSINPSVNKSTNKSMNKSNNESFDHCKKLKSKLNDLSNKSDNKSKSFIANNDSRGDIKTKTVTSSNSFIIKNKSERKIFNKFQNDNTEETINNLFNKNREMKKADSKEKLKSSNLIDYYNNIRDKYLERKKNFNSINTDSIQNKSKEKKYGYIKTKKSSENLYKINNIKNNEDINCSNNNENNYGSFNDKNHLMIHRKNTPSFNLNVNHIIKSHFSKIGIGNYSKVDYPSENDNNLNNITITMGKNIEDNNKNLSLFNENKNISKNRNDSNNKNNTKDNINNLSNNFGEKNKIQNHNFVRQAKQNYSASKIQLHNKSPISLNKNNHYKSNSEIDYNNYNSHKCDFKSEVNKTGKSTEIAIQFDMNNNSFSENNNYSLKNISNLNDTGKTEKEQNHISNFEKYYNHLLDKKTYLELKIKEYKEEYQNLFKSLNEETDGKYEICNKIQNEINHYKSMSETCLKNCNQLSGEIIALRKEIEKYVSNSQTSFSTLSTNNNMSSKGSKKTINEKLSGISGFFNAQ